VKNVPIEHGQQMLIVLNKADQLSSSAEAIVIQENVSAQTTFPSVVISAGKKLFLDVLLSQLQTMTEMNLSHHDHIVSNTRHLASFTNAAKSLQLVKQGLQNHLSGEFISIDLRAALHALSEVTGQISSEDILGAVFSRFCIGK
jgi:tRNA modification GTPase